VPSIRKSKNVKIPEIRISARPKATAANKSGTDGLADDWDDEMHALFEWAGLAMLGSERYARTQTHD
jgi:ribonucleases P/MRP protein subunit RPP40